MEDRSFLGRGWHFPPEFNKSGCPTVMVSEDEDICQSLYILLSTTPGERVHRPEYGCPINKYLFEIMDVTTQTLMKEQIERSIIYFEPRITLNNIKFEMNQQEGTILIHLDYIVRQTNRRSNMVYPFYLKEGTEIKL